MLGMGLRTFTLVHVAFSLIAIAAGIVVSYSLVRRRPAERWTALFLATTALTSISGFGFPFHKVLPSHIFGVLTLISLAVAIPARYRFHLTGRWQPSYVISSVVALYLNVFVLIVQLFLKVPSLKALAPTQTELPFAAVQFLTLLLFFGLTVVALRRMSTPLAVGAAAK